MNRSTSSSAVSPSFAPSRTALGPGAHTLCALLAGAALATSAHAAPGDVNDGAAVTDLASATTAPAVPLDTVVVTATRNAVPEDELIAATVVIDRAEIERVQATDVAQLLQLRAGLDIGRTGGPGQPSSVFIRGGNSDQTLVLIDGVRVNPASLGGAALSLIAPEMIERIEIVKGPRSTLYGSDALAGVINIITRTPEGVSVGAFARGGSYGTQNYGGRHTFGTEHARFGVSIERTDVDGFPTFRGADNARGLKLTTYAVRGEVDLGAKARVKAQAWRAEGTNEYLSQQLAFGGPPDFATTLAGFTNRDHDTLNQTAAVAFEADPTSFWQTRLQLSHTTDKVEENQGNALLQSQRPELRFDNVFRFAGQRLSVGGNVAQDRVDIRGGDTVGDVRDLGAVYAQGELEGGPVNGVLGVSFNRYDGFDSELTYNAEAGVKVWRGGRLLAAYGTGFRAPSASQRFGAFGGNPDLEPEKSRSYEAGVQQRLTTQRFGSHTVDLRAFRNDVRDLIVFNFDATQADFGDNRNLNRARTEGVELAYEAALGALELRLEGTVQSARDCSADEEGNALDDCDGGARLKRRNARSVSGAVTWRAPRWYLGVDALGAADRRDFEGQPPFRSNVRNAGYGLVNASAGATLDAGFSLALRGENLLDQDYTTANGYNQAGLSGFATLRYDWAQAAGSR